LIGYVDSSVLVPLTLEEPTSQACEFFWNSAHDVTSSELAYVECASALAAAQRAARISREQHRRGLRRLDEYWSELGVIDADRDLVARAAVLADRLALRAYDAVHAASAESIGEQDLVAAAGDRRLLAAWSALGIVTFDPNDPA
jgi:predicted nucleic acid-binding protein